MATARAELTPGEWDFVVEWVDKAPKDQREKYRNAVREIKRAQTAAHTSYTNEMAERERRLAKHPQAPPPVGT